MDTTTKLPHEGHVPSLPGRTNTGEKYITRAINGPAGHGLESASYDVFSGGNTRTNLPRAHFSDTSEGFFDAITYRDAILAGRKFERTSSSRRRALLTNEQLDALRTSPQRPVYTRAEPDLPWQECEELVEADLRATYPFAFVFIAKNVPGFGSDLGVAFPNDEYWFVEVKKAHTNLTRNEYLRAMEQGESYVIALVNKNREITYIHNPRDTGKFEEQLSVTYKWSAS
jgi:hypothetical protein